MTHTLLMITVRPIPPPCKEKTGPAPHEAHRNRLPTGQFPIQRHTIWNFRIVQYGTPSLIAIALTDTSKTSAILAISVSPALSTSSSK